MNKLGKQTITFVLLTIVTTSCGVVTKHYKSPDKELVDSLYRDTVSQDTASLANVPWQELFPDDQLQSLIYEGIDNNTDMRVAIQNMNIAQAGLRQSKMAFVPQVNLDIQGGKSYKEATNIDANQWQAGLSASWELDIWGKLTSAKKSAYASMLQTDAARKAIQTKLIATIATSYYQLLVFDEQLAITQQTIKSRIEEVETMNTLKESARITGADLVQSEANLYAAQLSVPDLKRAIREQENALCILLGRIPSTIKRSTLAEQTVREDLPVGMPTQLLKNRPDVFQAEYAFRSAFENTNVARANFYPSLTITGDGGVFTTSLDNFFSHSLFYNIFGGLTQPIFNKGLNRARMTTAKANQQKAYLNYRQTILKAGQEVSDALCTYKMATEKEMLRTQQIKALQKSVDFTKELLTYSSKTNYMDVLNSEEALLRAQISQVNDQFEKLRSVVNLYQAIGGGWK